MLHSNVTDMAAHVTPTIQIPLFLHLEVILAWLCHIVDIEVILAWLCHIVDVI